MPAISIITPAYIDTYDKLRWLEETIQSVQSQTFDDWEMIIVNDNSPIMTHELEAKYTSPKFRWFKTSQQNGPALTRNTAVELSESNCLFPLDADDALAENTALETMFKVWSENTKKIIYGDLQRYEEKNGEYQRSKIFSLPDYTFERSLDLNGIMPVSCMHSWECWKAAGGWKNELEAGREDVEYWIAAGKAGFCGKRIPETVLLYRRHETSRDFNLRRVNRRENEMRNRIRLMHQDVYEGRYPMGCCGGGQPYVPPKTNNNVAAPTSLDQFAESEKVWVEYNGLRQGNFGVKGPYTNISYRVRGPGHKLQVHANDKSKFERAGRGNDFNVGVAPPGDYIVSLPQEPEEFTAPEPVLAEIVQLDDIAAARQNGA